MRMKRVFSIVTILLIILAVCFFYRTEIVSFALKNMAEYTNVSSPSSNSYKNDFKFSFVQDTDNFHVKSRQDILNVIYTVLNSGVNSFTFYCDKDFDGCSDELESVSENQTLLSVINNMVSPYNSYQKLYITTNAYGRATIEVKKLYSDADIKAVNEKINSIKAEIINDGMSNRDKIKAFHDYLINNTVYDEDRASLIEKGDDTTYKYNSHKANGPLLEGFGLCSGYSDAMKLFLDDLDIPNYKVANDNHIWNLVYIDNAWLHLDLTWDDPVTSDHSNLLLHKFFLVDTNTLLSLDTVSHSFNRDYYPEIKS